MSKEPIHSYYFYGAGFGQAICTIAIIANSLSLMLVGLLVVVCTAVPIIVKHRRNVS